MLQENSSENRGSVPESHVVSCTDNVRELGYEGLYSYLGEFGLLPSGSELYYETPFTYNEDGSLAEPSAPHSMENRVYEICREGSGGVFREPQYSNCFEVPDMSYLIEPMEGIWLLALDTNVYVPRADADQTEKINDENFSGSGNAGYNKVLTHKKHLLSWMADVARRAKENGKMLISFSHFPAADFYNRAGPLIEEVWGSDEFQMVRIPGQEATAAVAATGVRLHIGGHMHMNGLEIAKDQLTGNVLTNIQVPSLAAYVPAFKIVRTFEDHRQIETETVILDNVPGFDTLFPFYEQEWNYLNSMDYGRIWNREILKSKTYHEFTDWHIRELSRLRFLPGEWPDNLRELLKNSTGRHLLIASQLPAEAWRGKSWTELQREIDKVIESHSSSGREEGVFRTAMTKAEELVRSQRIDPDDFDRWDCNTLSVDFYRIRNAGELALRKIPDERLRHYSLLARAFGDQSGTETADSAAGLLRPVQAVFEVMSLFSSRLPGEHAIIDLKTGDVVPVEKPDEGI